ncbi:epithelial membrane protein 2-like [Rhineura floridana]|uniref:epithelial membrane protein 2-like n=1 Tax=Rhineura floridana TaxID=261503 RepID=UPI002AC881E2|nr:epithelial membrane protein 2-like [Rhineura floridana]
MHVLQISATVCSFISLLLLLIALGSDYWININDVHTGLWRVCSQMGCVQIGMNLPDFFHTTRAFMLIGMIAGAVSFFALCATFFHFQLGSISQAKIAAVASLLAGLCVMIAMATFTGFSGADITYYGWSFGLGWASFPLYLITGFYYATRVFMLMGLIPGVVSLFGLSAILFQCHIRILSKAMTSAIASLIAGLCH